MICEKCEKRFSRGTKKLCGSCRKELEIKTMGGVRPGAGRPEGSKDEKPRAKKPRSTNVKIGSYVNFETAQKIEERAMDTGKTRSRVISEILEDSFII